MVKENAYLYSIVDIVILPSRIDPFPFVMLEAGAFKKPFIGGNTGGINEVEANNLNVYLSNNNMLNFSSNQPIDGQYFVYDLNGAELMKGDINGPVLLNAPAGMYIVKTKCGDKFGEHKVIKY